MKYRIELTETQFKTVQSALEMWERMMMGQFSGYADEIAKNGYEYNKDDPDNSRKFDDYIIRRDDCQEFMNRAYKIACPRPQNKTNDMRIIENIWLTMRYQLWEDMPEPKSYDTVDSRKPLGVSDEPILKIERVDE